LAPDDPNTPLNGDTITFKIGGGCVAPLAATGFVPANSAVNVPVNQVLSWTAGAGALSHDVYFGTAVSPPFIQNQAGTSYNPGPLLNNTVYYWKIDEVSTPASCKTAGTVLSFTTAQTRSITTWKSLRLHTGLGDLAITLNPALTTTAVSECRGTGANMGVFKVHVVFNGAVTGLNAAGVAVLYTPTIQAGPSMGSPVGVTPATATMFDASTLELTFTSGQLPNLGCAKITIGASTFNETITGDVDCQIRVVAADTNNSGTVTSTDQSQVKAAVTAGTLASANPRLDINLSGGAITTTDQNATKAQVGSPIKTALCP
jgi:hypothetical protein